MQTSTSNKKSNVEQQRNAPKSFFKFYQQLSTLRITDDIKFGHFYSVYYNNDIFAFKFKRAHNGEFDVVVLNLGSSAHTKIQCPTKKLE